MSVLYGLQDALLNRVLQGSGPLWSQHSIEASDRDQFRVTFASDQRVDSVLFTMSVR
jgi:hypothetical protein